MSTFNIIIMRSSKPDKKYDAVLESGKIIRFGSANYEDYTIHKDDKRKAGYLNRHKKRENWNDISKASFYATNLLWNKPTLKESVEDTNRRFPNVRVTLHSSLK